MISDSAIKQKFIIDQLKDAADSAFQFQLNSFRQYRKSKTGNTLRALSGPDYLIFAGGDEFILSATVARQLRFQDLGFRKLYTRPLFGALKHAYGTLQYGLHEDIRETIRQQLQNALNQS